MAETHFLIGKVSDIPLNSSRKFRFREDPWDGEGFVVRGKKGFYAYLNKCPHWNIGMDCDSDDFLSVDRRHIVCANHSALFEIDTGRCIAGPCEGRALIPLRVTVVGDQLYVAPLPGRAPEPGR